MDEKAERYKESNNLNHGIVLDIPNVSNSEESSSCGGENQKGKQIGCPVDEGTSGNSSNPVSVVEIVSIRKEDRDISVQINEVRPRNRESDEETCAVGSTEETVILVNSEENQRIQSGLETSEARGDKSTKNVREGKKKSSYVIDERCGNGCERERVCRICHLMSSEGLADNKATGFCAELMQLGCGCKDELGIAHGNCAEAWFKLKGNRICEICGEMARNITGVGDNRFIEEWNQRRYVGTAISIPSDGSNGRWRRQPFCNFLMGCLVVAFVLPWFFRGNMF